ncbi:class I SAM-dependent methyltransferase [Ruegeria lacuscaerulensis]|uniref:class I SAM-dependent methyltransferase n=1 Tax=Ruegeria lacuscaerulensis TaxID=55218 RepID=UPI00147DC592|nr:class I SAM-dependent methyltransferase [Ruegeria lacuscaerulensis]
MRSGVRNAFESKDWSGRQGGPRSGVGSTLIATAPLRKALPEVFERYKVKTLLDAPCGDWTWMQEVDLTGINYIGGDISLEVVQSVQQMHAGPGREFIHLDITSDPLPKADMILCRDCLFHLKWWLRWAFFENFVQSGIPYLLTTMHHVEVNERLRNNAGFKRFNPRVEPFNFDDPIEEILETGEINLDPDFLQTREGRDQRSLGIWSRAQVMNALERRSNGT